MSSGTHLKDTAPEKPVLKFSQQAWEKIWAITRGNKVNGTIYECSSLGIVAEDDPCLVEDIIVIKQKNDKSSTVMDQDKLGELTVALHGLGIKPSRIALWHHTHADFEAYWSGTDLATMERYAADGLQWSVVTSTKDGGQILVRADLFKPFRTHFDNCEFQVIYPKLDLTEWTSSALAKMETQATTPVNQYPSHGSRGSHWNRGQGSWKGSNNGRAQGVKSEKKAKKQARLKAIQELVENLDLAYQNGIIGKDEGTMLAKGLLDGSLTVAGIEKVITKRVEEWKKSLLPETDEKVVKTEGSGDEKTAVVDVHSDAKDGEEICVSVEEVTTTTKTASTQPTN